MNFPVTVRLRIYELLLAPDQPTTHDRPCESHSNESPESPQHQLRYKLYKKMATFPDRYEDWQATYFVSSNSNSTSPSGIKTSILRTSKVVYEEAITVLYGQTVFFLGSAQGALS